MLLSVYFEFLFINGRIEYKQFPNRSICPIDRTLIGKTNPGQSGPNEELYIPPDLKIHNQMQFNVIPRT